MSRRLTALVLLAPLALLAGCGGSSKPYTAKATAPCLEKKGFAQVTTDPLKVGLIAGFAENGGLRARAGDGNVLTIAFAADEAGATSTQQAYRNHANRFYKRRMADIMQSQRNAVLVWQTAPTQAQIADATGCLGS